MTNRANFRMLTIPEAAEYYGLPRHFIRQLVIQKKIQSIMAGIKYLINNKVLENYLTFGAVCDKM
jgi:excisionase family DNA binding protein